MSDQGEQGGQRGVRGRLSGTVTLSFLSVILMAFAVSLFYAYQFIQLRGYAQDNRATITSLERLRAERVKDQNNAFTTTCRRYNVISLVTSNTLDYLLRQADVLGTSTSPEVRQFHEGGPSFIARVRRNIEPLDCSKLLPGQRPVEGAP